MNRCMWTDVETLCAHSETQRIVLRKQRKRNVQQRRVAFESTTPCTTPGQWASIWFDYLRRLYTFPLQPVTKRYHDFRALGLHIVPSQRNSIGAIVHTIVKRKGSMFIPPLCVINEVKCAVKGRPPREGLRWEEWNQMIIRRAFNKFPEEPSHVLHNLLLHFPRRSVYSTEVVLFPIYWQALQLQFCTSSQPR